MNELITVKENENLEQVVSGRELHDGLGISKDFTNWFKNQIKRLNLKEGRDFTPYRAESTGGRPSIEYAVTLDTAKHICMISGGEKAWEIRDYFIEIEKQWNSPDAVLARAMKIANKKMLSMEEENRRLKDNLHHKTEVIRGMTEDVDTHTKRAVINRVVRHKGANFRERWGELYKVFRETYSVDLPARREGHNLRQTKKKDHLSIIQYAERFGHIDNLYLVASKLYETDVEEILENLKKIA